MHAMWKPQKFKAIYLLATIYVLTLTLPSAAAVYWAFGDLLLNHSNAFSLLPRSPFRDMAVILMLIHQACPSNSKFLLLIQFTRDNMDLFLYYIKGKTAKMISQIRVDKIWFPKNVLTTKVSNNFPCLKIRYLSLFEIFFGQNRYRGLHMSWLNGKIVLTITLKILA